VFLFSNPNCITKNEKLKEKERRKTKTALAGFKVAENYT
jgi:hypothetical protein